MSEARIGPYRLLHRVGGGGMGVVHLALAPDDRAVAVKVLRPEVAGDATARARFAREVSALRRVKGRHVAQVLDADVEGDPAYLVTRYVPGRPLEDVLAADGPLRGDALQRFAAGLADALVAIHEAGVVHRDLKPGNVLLLDGEPVVIDFGIAREMGGAALTSAGLVVGTPGFLAPEVVRGEAVTASADVFAWGATVAVAATGRSPYGSGALHEVLYRVASHAPDLSGVPDSLAPLVAAAMCPKPAARPSAPALLAVLRGEASPSTLILPALAPAALPVPPRVEPPPGDPPAGHTATRVVTPVSVAVLDPAPTLMGASFGGAPTARLPRATGSVPLVPAPAAHASPTRSEPGPPRPPRAGRVALGLALLALAAGGGALAPGVTVLALLTGALALRAVAGSAAARQRRLARRGGRWWDGGLTAVGLPYQLFMALPPVLGTALLGLLAAAGVAVVVLGGLGAAGLPTTPDAAAAAAAAGCLVFACIVAAGGRASDLRVGGRLLLDPVARRPPVAAALSAGVLVIALSLGASGARSGPSSWPGPLNAVTRLGALLPG